LIKFSKFFLAEKIFFGIRITFIGFIFLSRKILYGEIILNAMRKNILNFILALATLSFSFLGWFSVYRAINVEGSSIWLTPILCFSFFYIFLCLNFVLMRKRYQAIFLSGTSLVLSFFFSFHLWHGAIFLGAFFLSFLAYEKIRKNLEINTKIEIYKSVSFGKFFLVLAISLLISSQFYFAVRESRIDSVPEIKLDKFFGFLIPKVLNFSSTQLEKMENEESTVDQFIIAQSSGTQINFLQNDSVEKEIEEKIAVEFGENISTSQKEALKNQMLEKIQKNEISFSNQSQKIALENGRKKLSDLLEREVKGDEKTSFVFSEIINKKINENFQSNISKEKGNSTWPIVLTFILFLTIWPLGSLLADGLAFGTGFIFWLTLKFKLVKIVKVMVEAQRIE